MEKLSLRDKKKKLSEGQLVVTKLRSGILAMMENIWQKKKITKRSFSHGNLEVVVEQLDRDA